MSVVSYNWYKLFALPDWISEGLVARSLVVQLEDRGRERFEITQGNTTAIRHDDTFLPLNFLDQNPYARDGKAVYVDPSDNVWFGFEE